MVSHGFWAITMRPTPMRAMISIDSGDTAEANVRPLKLASGLGPDLDRRLLVQLAVVLHDAGLEGLEQRLGCTP